MTPLIQTRAEVAAVPVGSNLVEVGNIALNRVEGTVYMHLAKAVDKQRRRPLTLATTAGGTNGWTRFAGSTASLYGWAGVERPGACPKARSDRD
jgi:hypothetical protein